MKPNHILPFAALTFGVLLMQGCAGVPSENLKRTFTPTYYSASITDFPAVGDIKTVEVGETLVSKDKQTSIPAIDIEQTIEHPVVNLGNKLVLTALSGRYVEKGKDAFGKYFEAKHYFRQLSVLRHTIGRNRRNIL